jgi:hypothetical protein
MQLKSWLERSGILMVGLGDETATWLERELYGGRHPSRFARDDSDLWDVLSPCPSNETDLNRHG